MLISVKYYNLLVILLSFYVTHCLDFRNFRYLRYPPSSILYRNVYTEPTDIEKSLEDEKINQRSQTGDLPWTSQATDYPAHMNQENLEREVAYGNQNYQKSLDGEATDIYFVVIVAGVSAAAIFGVVGAGYCFYKFQQQNKAAADVDYPAYGIVGPAVKENGSVSPSGDRKLAQSAQMYHYHHQKQQMIASEKASTCRNTSSDVDSEEENEEGEYTVYECQGLGYTGEMEVKNPLFIHDVTPGSPSPSVQNKENN